MSERKSYEAHAANITNNIKTERFFPVLNKDSFVYKVIQRPLEDLLPLCKTQNSWLTIGDLQGFEAHFLNDKKQHAVASDIGSELLEQAQKLGVIQQFEIVNVENIKFEENSFDYVMCKEAYHHFPRAFLGFYEMIRVAKKGAILMEPIDPIASMPLLLFIKNILDRINPNLINKVWKNRFSFETVGNYVFKLSERDVEKMAMGIGLSCLAFKGINVSYKQLPDEIMNSKYEPATHDKYERGLVFKNILCKLGIIPYNLLTAIAFKIKPTIQEREDLKARGFKIIDLPENPYI